MLHAERRHSCYHHRGGIPPDPFRCKWNGREHAPGGHDVLFRGGDPREGKEKIEIYFLYRLKSMTKYALACLIVRAAED